MSDTETIDETITEEAPHTRQALTLAPSRLPMSAAIAKEFEIDRTQWRVLVEQTFPSAKTIEAVLMALSYCRARNLDIFKKPVHIVPMWSSELGRMVETVWPGIAEIRTTAARTGEYAGIDEVIFGPMVERKFTGTVGKGQRAETVTKAVKFPEWASVVVYRIVKGQRSAFHTKVFWEETYASIGKSDVPNDMWGKRPRGQLDKCVEAAALRKAFPEEVGSMYAAEEMEGRVIDAAATDVTPASRPTPPSPPEPPEPGNEPGRPPEGQKSGGGEPGEMADPAASSLHNSDHPEGRENEAAFVPKGEIGVEEEKYLAALSIELASAIDEASIEERFDYADPQTRLAGNDVAIAKAFQIKHDAVQALASKDREQLEAEGQGSFLDERHFPGDEPLPPATARALRNARPS